MGAQNIIELGFNITEFSAEKKQVYDMLMEIYELNKKIGENKTSGAGWGELKAQVAGLQQKVQELQEANLKYAASVAAVTELQKKNNEETKKGAEATEKETEETKKATTANTEYSNNQRTLLEIAAKNEIAMKKMAAEKKALTEAYNKGLITEQHYIESLAQIKQGQIALGVSSQGVNLALKNIEKGAQAADGSLNELRSELSLALQAFDRLSSDDRGGNIGQDLLKKIGSLTKEITAQEQLTGRFQRNVGNYANSLSGLFEKVTREISRLKTQQTELNNLRDSNPDEFKSRGGEDAINRTTAAIEQLDRVINIGTKTNQTYTTTIRGLEKGFIDMATSGVHSKEFITEFKDELGNAKDKANDLKESVKLAASDTKGLDVLINTAHGVAGAFAVAQGTVALFGDESEEIQKTLLKVNAVMSVLNGLQAIQEQLKKKDTIATYGQIAAQKIYALVVGTSTGAMKAFRIALASTGVGILIIGLISLISNMGKATSTTEKAAKATKEYSETVSELSDAISLQNDILSKNDKELKKKLQNELDLKKAAGTNASTELAYKEKIAAIDKKIADANYAAHGDVKNDLFEQTKELAVLNQKKKEALDITDRLQKQKEAGIKQVDKGLTDDEKIMFNGYGIPTTESIDKAIKRSKKAAAVFDEAITATKTAVEKIQKIQDDRDESDKNQQEIQLEIAKFNSDEARKYTLASAKIEADAVISKNELIISNEKSSLDERIAALKSNAEQRKKIAEAEKTAVLSDPTQSGSDKAIAKKQAAAESVKIDQETERLIFEEKEKYRIRKLQAEKDAADSEIGIQIARNQQIYNNENNSEKQRLDAYTDYLAKQKQLIINEAAFQIATKNLTSEELVALTQVTNDRLKALDMEAVGDRRAIRESELAQVVAHGQSIHEIAMKDIENLYNGEINALDQKFRKGLIKEHEYTKQRLKLQAEMQVKLLEEDIKFTEETVKLALLRAMATGNQADIDAAKQAMATLQGMRIELQKLKDGLDSLGDSETFKKWISDFNNIAAVARTVFDAIASFAEASYERQKNAIDELQARSDEYYAREIENVNKSSLTEQDRAARLIQLKAEQDAKNAQYAAKQRQRDVEKAKFDKAAAIAAVILNTAVAVSNALKALPFSLPDVIFAAAQGAIQLAAAIATPIPSYADGTDDHPGGVARYGEDGAEAVILPGGKAFIADKETVGFLPKRTKVIPLTSDNINDAMYGSMMHNTAERAALVEAVSNWGGREAWRIAKWQSEETKKAIEDNKTSVNNRINIINDFGWIEYVNKNIFGK